jgi:hypothetical protein
VKAQGHFELCFVAKRGAKSSVWGFSDDQPDGKDYFAALSRHTIAHSNENGGFLSKGFSPYAQVLQKSPCYRAYSDDVDVEQAGKQQITAQNQVAVADAIQSYYVSYANMKTKHPPLGESLDI